jgi:hypothetical protein
MRAIALLCGLTAVAAVVAGRLAGLVPHNYTGLLLIVGVLLLASLIDRVRLLCWSLAVAVTFAVVSVQLMYAIGTSHWPLADVGLRRLDAALGFDASAISQVVYHHAWLYELLTLSYNSILWQSDVLIICLSFTNRARLERLLLQMILGLYLTCVCFYFVPALGHCGVDPPSYYSPVVTDLLSLRAGTLTNVMSQNGIITFPSFHALCAILFVAACPCWPMILLNAAMIVSTIPIGQHYVIDIMGAILIYKIVSIPTRNLAELNEPLSADGAFLTYSFPRKASLFATP